VGYWVKVM